VYSCTFSLTSALDGARGEGIVNVMTGRYTLGKVIRYPFYRRLGGPVWMGADDFFPAGIQTPKRPARSESLYRLRYLGPRVSRWLLDFERHFFILIFHSTVLNSVSQSEAAETIIWSDFLKNVPSIQREALEVYFWHAVFWDTIYIFVYLALENTLYTVVKRDAYVTGVTRTNSVSSVCAENHSLSSTCRHHILLTCLVLTASTDRQLWSVTRVWEMCAQTAGCCGKQCFIFFSHVISGTNK
jgi:hypothetical protein